MPAIIFFEHLKDTIHLCSTSFGFHKRSLSTLLFFSFKVICLFTVATFSPIFDFQEFYYGIPSCDFFLIYPFWNFILQICVLIFSQVLDYSCLLFLQICFCLSFSLLIFCISNTHILELFTTFHSSFIFFLHLLCIFCSVFLAWLSSNILPSRLQTFSSHVFLLLLSPFLKIQLLGLSLISCIAYSCL